jgi:hypothetical protein
MTSVATSYLSPFDAGDVFWKNSRIELLFSAHSSGTHFTIKLQRKVTSISKQILVEEEKEC